jgi:uncharacterized membrane protein YqjE
MKRSRFTVRDLFWLMLVVAIGCSWWLERSRMTAQLEQLQKDLEFERLVTLIQTTIVPE